MQHTPSMNLSIHESIHHLPLKIPMPPWLLVPPCFLFFGIVTGPYCGPLWPRLSLSTWLWFWLWFWFWLWAALSVKVWFLFIGIGMPLPKLWVKLGLGIWENCDGSLCDKVVVVGSIDWGIFLFRVFVIFTQGWWSREPAELIADNAAHASCGRFRMTHVSGSLPCKSGAGGAR